MLPKWKAVDAYRKAVAKQHLVSRKVGDREKTGVFTGDYAVNPATGACHPRPERRRELSTPPARYSARNASIGPTRAALAAGR
jgi:hypothetical protein